MKGTMYMLKIETDTNSQGVMLGPVGTEWLIKLLEHSKDKILEAIKPGDMTE